MAAPNSTLWPYEPHTNAKHEILRRYLQAWFPILDKYYDRLVYLDGFAGPGEYEGGEPGSPLIVLDLALHHTHTLTGESVFIFVELKEDRYQHLEEIINRIRQQLPPNFKVYVENNEFSVVLAEALDDLDQKGLRIAPTFAFIDPFGFSGVPMSLIHRLLQRDRTEAFILFPIDSVNRFVLHPEEEIRRHMATLFGTEEVFDAVAQPDRRRALRKLYQDKLSEAAKFVRFFTMRDKTDKPIYDLFFASNNRLGHVKMKEAMWLVDEAGTFTFSDATDPLQSVLFTADPSPRLAQEIIQGGAERKNIEVSRITSWVEESTPYLRKHMIAALKLAEQKGKIHVHPVKATGKKRRKGTFPDDAIIDFLSAGS